MCVFVSGSMHDAHMCGGQRTLSSVVLRPGFWRCVLPAAWPLNLWAILLCLYPIPQGCWDRRRVRLHRASSCIGFGDMDSGCQACKIGALSVDHPPAPGGFFFFGVSHWGNGLFCWNLMAVVSRLAFYTAFLFCLKLVGISSSSWVDRWTVLTSCIALQPLNVSRDISRRHAGETKPKDLAWPSNPHIPQFCCR